MSRHRAVLHFRPLQVCIGPLRQHVGRAPERQGVVWKKAFHLQAYNLLHLTQEPARIHTTV